MPLDYLDHLARESRRFGDVLEATDAGTSVPTCPDWDADDLLWHLAEVQWFWGTIARDRLASPDGVDDRRPERPTDRSELMAWYEEVSADLGVVLAAAPPETPVWTWADDHTIGFIRRRQAHEALIHRLDAELTAGSRTPMDTALSADGVDEVLRVMYGGAPPWGTFTPEPPHTVRVATTDTGHSWVLTLGRFVGTDPDAGSALDVPDLRVAAVDDGLEVAAEVRGSAADLDCWLWHRPPVGTLVRTGSGQVLAALDSTIADGIS